MQASFYEQSLYVNLHFIHLLPFCIPHIRWTILNICYMVPHIDTKPPWMLESKRRSQNVSQCMCVWSNSAGQTKWDGGTCLSAAAHLLPLTYESPFLGIFKWISWWGSGLRWKREVWLLQRRDWKRGVLGGWRWGGSGRKRGGARAAAVPPWPQLHPLPPPREASHHERWVRASWQSLISFAFVFYKQTFIWRRTSWQHSKLIELTTSNVLYKVIISFQNILVFVTYPMTLCLCAIN